MDKTSMLLGWLVGRRIAGQRTQKKTPYKKGSLRCSTIDLTTATNKGGDTWEPITWNGLDKFSGANIWSDGKNIYYSYQTEQYVLNGDIWEVKTWNGINGFHGEDVWTDGKNIYLTKLAAAYGGYCILNGDTWETDNGLAYGAVSGKFIWTDGEKIYRSGSPGFYVWNPSSNSWESHSDLATLGMPFWSDGKIIYYSYGYNETYTHRTFNPETMAYEPTTWDGITSFRGDYIWSDGTNIYYSKGEEQYVLNGDMWEPKTWNGLTSFFASGIWTDGTNIYYSTYGTDGGIHYVLSNEVV